MMVTARVASSGLVTTSLMKARSIFKVSSGKRLRYASDE
jgi:hypothetical protein